ncbi:ribosomal protein L13 [Durotheca rogersii]|uniref:ribosomal protein L13 n=1 Tax=Durotheca rogersii TaxID=419775 RepID=UPI00221ED948|nr:ribosomal protein L13 [Durotheca rogersii]KAI5864606.1 ribosomal protein L13 [Durotheca rogersii]
MSQTIGLTKLAYSRVWHHISAKDLHPTLSTQPGVTPPTLGRLASRIAVILMGKHKPIWDPSTDCGDYVVVTGCAALHVTGRKKWQKTYYRHNTRPGSLRSVTMDVLMAKFGGAEILRRAVSGMLPKNRLRDKRLERLKAFEGDAHPYKQNLLRFGGVEVGKPGWDQAVKAIRYADTQRL